MENENMIKEDTTYANDPVKHPAHYTDGKIEVKEFIRDKKLNFFLGNVVKYVCRAGKKDKDKEIEDLKKAKWYLEDEIISKTIEQDHTNRNFVLQCWLSGADDEEVLVRWHKYQSDVLELRGAKAALRGMLDREFLEGKGLIACTYEADLLHPGRTILRIDING